MIIDLMHFNGCPHWREVLGHLESLRDDPGGFEIRLVEVTTPEAADEWQFHGSPSVAINGVDPFSDAEDPVGLTCRTYASDHGMTGSPTREQLRQAIISAKWVSTRHPFAQLASQILTKTEQCQSRSSALRPTS